jgi:transcriptional regulator with XRE-family HTH domain
MSAPSFQLVFGKRVRELREQKGYSQERFAAHADLDRSSFGKIERGETNVSLLNMARIAVALDLTLSQLVEGVGLDADEIKVIPRAHRGPSPIGGRRAA